MTGHINVVLVLQSFTDALQIMADSSGEMFPTSCDVTNIKAEDLDVKEMSVSREEEERVAIKVECIDVKEEVKDNGEEKQVFVGVKEENCVGCEGEEGTDVKAEDIDSEREEEEERCLDEKNLEDVDVKEEEIHMDGSIDTVEAETSEVSHLTTSVRRHISPLCTDMNCLLLPTFLWSDKPLAYRIYF
jgi:hypothetical protein